MCCEFSISTDPLKAQEKANSYLKRKIEACKIVLVIHITMKSEVQLEFSKSIFVFVMFIEKLWICMGYLEKYYLLCMWFYLEMAILDVDQEHILEEPGNTLLNFRVSNIRVSGC